MIRSSFQYIILMGTNNENKIFLNKKEQLIHDILFNHDKEWLINLEEYIDKWDELENFLTEVELAIKRGGIEIIESHVILISQKKHWKIKLKK